MKLDMLGEGGLPQRAACGSGDARGMQVEGRDTGGMWQEGGTQEGCSRREGHGMKVEGLWDKGVRMQYEGGTWHKGVGQCRSKQR
jgi:hypothetical protein